MTFTKVNAVVFNTPSNPKKYIVCRLSDGDLWYWGSWEELKDATKVAAEIGGLVVERQEGDV